MHQAARVVKDHSSWCVCHTRQCQAHDEHKPAEQDAVMFQCTTVLLLLTLACACAENASTCAALLRWVKASDGTVRHAI